MKTTAQQGVESVKRGHAAAQDVKQQAQDSEETVNASSSLILCRSIKMPLACSIHARDIIAMRRWARSSLVRGSKPAELLRDSGGHFSGGGSTTYLSFSRGFARPRAGYPKRRAGGLAFVTVGDCMRPDSARLNVWHSPPVTGVSA